MTQKVKFTWEDLDKAIDILSSKINKTTYRFDYIIGIVRGGLIPAVMLAHKLNIPLTISFDKLTGTILLVDDIIDDGTTINSYKEKINKNVEIISCSIHITDKTTQKVIPDFYYKKTSDWQIYPWETEETSKLDREDLNTNK